MPTVDYVIIGAGMAGLTLKRFLRNKNTVVIDPEPGGYKIGESIIPEHFHNVIVRALVPKARELPSYTRKWGSNFIAGDTIASFPLPAQLSAISMHIERAQLEKLMIDEWEIDVVQEKVVDVDMDKKQVKTQEGSTYTFNEQVIDCSGPAMVLGKIFDDISEILRADSIWSYWDIDSVDEDVSGEQLGKKMGKKFVMYNASEARLVEAAAPPKGWAPHATTTLTQVQKNVWLWQIPLYGGTRLSCGIASRAGMFKEKDFDEIVDQYHLPTMNLKKRERDGSSVYNRLHARPNFARRCATASTADYIRVADSFAFGDPIYSVGTGLAVNKAIQVAKMLNDEGWSGEKSTWFNEQYEALLVAAMGAFQFWYDLEMISQDDKAAAVQKLMLEGSVFGDQITEFYNSSLRCSMGDPDSEEHTQFPPDPIFMKR